MKKTLAFAGFGVALAAFVLSDLVNRGYDPMAEVISRYVNLPGGWIVVVALVAVSVGSLALAFSMRSRLIGFWGVCVLVAAVFPADPPGNWSDTSLSDTVHGVAAWAGFLGLAVAIVLLSRRGTTAQKVLAGAATVAFLLFVAAMVDRMAGTHTAPMGLAERVLIGLDLAWLALAARLAGRTDKSEISALAAQSGTMSGMKVGDPS
ncbi:DUF998 domain-containing protein [Nonomuraea sp. NBC_01738]|uniref:DUF998 domain-containing protein n=1 Tax=Nonomuraea sp. NBC_01738 TaxID=2976003 RepID=UPI002E0F0BFF|nr:DUF998 domain-containing protein [Nonomuraea sp. NBC_01738]